MSYPSTIDTFPTHSNGEVIDASYDNSQQTAIVALETKVGVDSSAVTSTLDYKLTNAASVSPGHKHAVADITDFVNASTTAKGIVEEAIASEVDAGTAAGSTGAELFINPARPSNYGVGIGPSTVAKTWFSTSFPFVTYTGETLNAATTDHTVWTKTSEVTIGVGGFMAIFVGTGAEALNLIATPFYLNNTTGYKWTTATITMDWFAKWDNASSGDVFLGGFGDTTNSFNAVYDDNAASHVGFAVRQADSQLYVTSSKQGTGTTVTNVSSGVTITNWNHYRVEFVGGLSVKYYINGALVSTVLSAGNLPNSTSDIESGFGRSNTALFEVTAPNIAIKLI